MFSHNRRLKNTQPLQFISSLRHLTPFIAPSISPVYDRLVAPSLSSPFQTSSPFSFFSEPSWLPRAEYFSSLPKYSVLPPSPTASHLILLPHLPRSLSAHRDTKLGTAHRLLQPKVIMDYISLAMLHNPVFLMLPILPCPAFSSLFCSRTQFLRRSFSVFRERHLQGL